MFSCYKVRHVYLCKIIGILILFSMLLVVLRFSALHEESNTESSRLLEGNIVGDVAEYVHNGIHKNAPSARNNELLQNLSHPLFQLLEPEDNTTINETMFFQLSETQMSQVPDKFSIQGSSICSADDVDLLIFMMSVARDEDAIQRLKIRETWASSLYDHKWKQTTRTGIVFFFGDKALNVKQKEALRKESQIYGDVVVGQFHDSYGNLSVKMVAGLTWAVRNCGQVRHLAKIDMDTYVNIQVLLELVKNVSDQFTEYVLGYENKFREVWRTGKWAISEKGISL